LVTHKYQNHALEIKYTIKWFRQIVEYVKDKVSQIITHSSRNFHRWDDFSDNKFSITLRNVTASWRTFPLPELRTTKWMHVVGSKVWVLLA
jgi:hypothetical protein